jgi:hypothetical protein
MLAPLSMGRAAATSADRACNPRDRDGTRLVPIGAGLLPQEPGNAAYVMPDEAERW